MRTSALAALVVIALPACTGGAGPDPAGEVAAPVDAKAVDAKAVDAKTVDAKPIAAKALDAKAVDAKAVDAKPIAAPPSAATPPAAIEPVAPAPVPAAIAIAPWTTTAHAATWTPAAEPSEPLALALDLNAGVLGRAGSTWFQVGKDGQLAAIEMKIQPKPPIVGVWPSDAWFVDKRVRMEDTDGGEPFEYIEIRLMKLRDGHRWVPQVYSGTGEQWFHPGTDDEDEPHMSTLSGMLVYPASLESITRVAGRQDDPVIGPHRGDAVDFIETGAGKVYVISRDADGYYAQIACEDDECVAANVKKLPLSQWTFARRVARGKHSVSVLATSGDRGFILHHRGKSDGWLLEELPAGETPIGMWASEEGGLWTLTGERLRWRDTESVWHDVALPDGLTTPSVALSEDRKQVWVSGVVSGAAKVFTTTANAAP